MTEPENGDQLHRLIAVTDATLAQLDVDDLLSELAYRIREVMGTDTSAILLLDASGRELVATAASGLEDEVHQGVRIPVGEGFAGRIAASTQPLVIDRVDHTTVVNQILVDQGLSAMAGVPITASGQVLGVLHVGSRTPRQFSTEDIELLRVVADRAGMAAQARISRLERQTTVALQRSLLPARPPAVDGFDVAARYVPGAEVGVGGDWYDLFNLPSGHVGVAIGDVAGSGLRAAVVMGRIRSALRAYALETHDPADVLTRLDRKIQLFEPNAMATAAYAVVDPARTTLTVTLAGHLPPIWFDAHGAARQVEVPTDLPLGAYPNAPRRATTIPLPHALLLYTDGLVERRDRPLRDTIIELLATFGRASTADQLCVQALSSLHHAPATDDIALLALRRQGPHRPMWAHSQLAGDTVMGESPAESAQPAPDTMSYTVAGDLTGLRAFVRTRADTLGLPAHRGDLLALAVNELATNTLQYTDSGGTVRVWASRGQVVCDLVDSGPMRSFDAMPAPDSVRGRGLAIVARIVDTVAATTTADGTLVRVRMDL